MFLKNVPPVIALHTEWRSYRSAQTFSLPVCFNDSDSDISSTGTPIPEKVQMIIESLRSTQSSLDTNNDYRDSMQMNQARTKCCDGKTKNETHKVKQKITMVDAKAVNERSDAAEMESLFRDSDSDDSVDRGIEEAIQEYLKERSDHGGSLTNNSEQCHKTPSRGDVVTLEQALKKNESSLQSLNTAPKELESLHYSQDVKVNASKRSRCSSSSSASSDDSFDQSIQEEIRRFLTEKKEKTAVVPIAKKPKLSRKDLSHRKSKRKIEAASGKLQVSKQIRKDAPSFDSEKKTNGNKVLTASNHLQQIVKSSQSMSTDKCRRREKSPGSNLKKATVSKPFVSKNPALFQIKKECVGFCPNQPRPQHHRSSVKEENETDSSSDDGIEEAILRYQLEKQKEKCENSLKFSRPSETKQPHVSLEPSSVADIQIVKIQKGLSKKKKKQEKQTTLLVPSSLNKLGSHEIKGNDVASTSGNDPDPNVRGPLTVNTTAELMCAEAILDISKAVMPPNFDHVIKFTDPCVNPTSLPQENMPYSSENSNNSSVDSDDGIEQEIRKFLEMKAQMNRQEPDTGILTQKESSMAPQQKKKLDSSQTMKHRLSLTHKRRQKEEELNLCKDVHSDHRLKEDLPQVPVKLCVRNDSAMPLAISRAGEVCEKSAVPLSEEVGVNNEDQKSYPVNQKDAKDSENHEGNSLHSCQTKNEVSKASYWIEGKLQVGDKSSSLDSDEDLDAATKDLLKTKRKVKRKMRDLKLKSKKTVHFGAVQLCSLDLPETEKKKNTLLQESAGANHRTKSGIAKRSRIMPAHHTADKNVKSKLKRNTSKHLNSAKKQKASSQAEQSDAAKGHRAFEKTSDRKGKVAAEIVEDSSSVDSDDSIEQEIRRFLAEKAKVSVVRSREEEVKNETKELSTSTCISVSVREPKLEPQQAEFSANREPKRVSLLHCSGQNQQACRTNEDGQNSTLGFQGCVIQTVDKGPQSPKTVFNSFFLNHQADNVAETKQMHEGKKSCSEQNRFHPCTAECEANRADFLTTSVILSAKTISKHAHKNSTSQAGQEALKSESKKPFQIKAFTTNIIKRIQPLNASDNSNSSCFGQQRQARQLSETKTYDATEDACNTVRFLSGHESKENAHTALEVKFVNSSNSSAEHSSGGNLRFPGMVRQLGEACTYEHVREPSCASLPFSFSQDNGHNNKDRSIDTGRSISQGCSVQAGDKGFDQEGAELRKKRGEENKKFEIKEQTTGDKKDDDLEETFLSSDEERSASKRSDISEDQPRLLLSSSIDPGLMITPYIVLNSAERLQKYSVPRRQILSQTCQIEKIEKTRNVQNIIQNKLSIDVGMFYKKKNRHWNVKHKKKKKKKNIKRKLHFHPILKKKKKNTKRRFQFNPNHKVKNCLDRTSITKGN
nr:PREDICTED: protein phosphatase 1 regulatory subunit 26 isoform X2 [Lepisosteus oculatus]